MAYSSRPSSEEECKPTGPQVTLTEVEIVEMFASPASSAFLNTRLKGVLSKDTVEFLLALQDLNNVYGKKVFDGRGGQRAVNAATFLLEGGILDPLAEGLKRAAAGQWMVDVGESHPVYSVYSAQCGRHGELVSLNLKQPLLVLYALGSAALDARLVRFILKKRPDIVRILEDLFTAAARPGVPDGLETRTEVARTLNRLASFSEVLRKQLGQNSGLMSKMIAFALAHVSKLEIFDCPFLLICNMRYFLRIEDVLPGVIELAAKVILESKSKANITAACTLVRNLNGADWSIHKKPETPLWNSAVLALAICEALPDDVRDLGWVFSCMCWAMDSDLPQDIESPTAYLWTRMPDFVLKLKRLAQTQFPLAYRRAQQLGLIFSSDEPSSVDRAARMVTMSKGGLTVKDPEFKGVPLLQQKALQKCCWVKCDRKESAPSQFKACSKCRLVVYCGVGCQKSDWKEGHKTVCR